MHITDTTTDGPTYTRTEYSTSANKRSGALAAILQVNRGKIEVSVGRYATEEGRIFFLHSIVTTIRQYKTEAGALRAIAKHLAN